VRALGTLGGIVPIETNVRVLPGPGIDVVVTVEVDVPGIVVDGGTEDVIGVTDSGPRGVFVSHATRIAVSVTARAIRTRGEGRETIEDLNHRAHGRKSHVVVTLLFPSFDS
jgi:hypothetical protein